MEGNKAWKKKVSQMAGPMQFNGDVATLVSYICRCPTSGFRQTNSAGTDSLDEIFAMLKVPTVAENDRNIYNLPDRIWYYEK
ncbi:hypothetical protein [Chitinophaga nivalis]|uniref:Transposase n=1 Tax=Chitinophaga nivalis TaxID=2991709 RepID=A0ABT3ITK3_9BACT|nr:hypothetical protein [Chitinophaga nivalis]MCW3463003.1 hypothetical protein [Chitinophaga nivalis]MCW3487307.1 hypothetical protein [Chitinophaga nivalis]